ncbi:MAG TPA: SDR family oxidoreductase [Acidimicrobiia bacterium]|nr:SDR family oxidoreductase [Acidimicrobiia bacterium]
MRIEGAVAVVTGGASGIGRSTVVELARRGADVVIADVNDLRMEAVHREVDALGRRALVVHCDVSLDRDVERLRREVMEEMGRVDILMNNAGVALLGPPETIPAEDWDWLLQINLMGPIRGVRAFLPHMMERGSGYIVNTASVAGLYAYHWDTIPYITAKHGVVGFTEGLKLYAEPHGVKVSVLCPGLVSTNLAENARLSGLDDPSQWVSALPRDYEAIDADAVGPMVADAIRDERYLILTHPELMEPVLEERGRDLAGAIEKQRGRISPPPNIHK